MSPESSWRREGEQYGHSHYAVSDTCRSFLLENCLPSVRQKGDWASLGVFTSILRDSGAVIVSCMFASLMDTKLDVSNLLTWILKAIHQTPPLFGMENQQALHKMLVTSLFVGLLVVLQS